MGFARPHNWFESLPIWEGPPEIAAFDFMQNEEVFNQCFQYVLQFFNYDVKRAALWFGVNNPNLGGYDPMTVCIYFSTDKLWKWICGRHNE